MFTFSQTSIITVGSYEHRALYSRLDVESIVSGGLVVLHSPRRYAACFCPDSPGIGDCHCDLGSWSHMSARQHLSQLNFFSPWMTWPFPAGRLPGKQKDAVFSLKELEQLYVVMPRKELSRVLEVLCDIMVKVALVRGAAFCLIKRANQILHLTVRQSAAVSAVEMCSLWQNVILLVFRSKSYLGALF